MIALDSRILQHAILSIFLVLLVPIHASDLLIADFEEDSYGEWLVEGTAFGDAPAAGALPRQRKVAGYEGDRLVNSFYGGDRSTGKLTSPAFDIERKFLNFLIGGGGYADVTCMNLLIEGRQVRTATGPNIKPGGEERLEWRTWDVSEFVGQSAVIEIVDQRAGRWGHINVDQIEQSDAEKQAVQPVTIQLSRTLRIDMDFLQLPLMQRDRGNAEGIKRFTVEDEDGTILRFMHLEFAEPDQVPDFWYSADLREFRGQELVFRFESTDPTVLSRLELSEEELIAPNTYEGRHRPRFHFSPRIGWMNDINGTYYQDGLYHLFYQYNPTTAGKSTGFDMHWGHSVSKDLVHWEEWPIALFPDNSGKVFSGTALLVDEVIPGVNEDSPTPTPMLFFTGTRPFSQHFATSSDGGKTWQRFGGNPVLPTFAPGNRDPKVIWHEPSQHYIMIVFGEKPDAPRGFHFFRSKDLVEWEETSFIPNWFECPEFIPLKSASTGEDLWMLYGFYQGPLQFGAGNLRAPSAYQLGRFDGETFEPISEVRVAHRGPNFYGALTFQDEPHGRNVMMGWTRSGSYPGEPFNQSASIPLELSLRNIAGEDTLFIEPVSEVGTLRGSPQFSLKDATLREANTMLRQLRPEGSYDVLLELDPASSASFKACIRKNQFFYDFSKGTLALIRNDEVISSSELHPEETLHVRFLIDRGIVESFWNQGEAAFSIFALHSQDEPPLELTGQIRIKSLSVYPVANIWESTVP
ncbi:glycoside hydrolase family 32 protein [Coraliomargarita sp. W4R53]